MDRWREMINDLIRDLQVEDRPEISRTSIDNKIWEREKIAAHTELARPTKMESADRSSWPNLRTFCGKGSYRSGRTAFGKKR